LTTYILNFAGTEDQKERYLKRILNGEITMAYLLTEPGSPGSNPAEMETWAEWIEDDAHEDGGDWIIHGVKHWITVGDNASAMIVFAYDKDPAKKDDAKQRKINAFIVDRHTPGVSVKPQKMGGLYGSGTSEIRFENVRVPARNHITGENNKWVDRGFNMAMKSLNSGRNSVASISLGSMGRDLHELSEYLKLRMEQGAPEEERLALQAGIEDIIEEMFAARELLNDSSRAKSRSDENPEEHSYILEASMAKLLASEKALAISHKSMRLRGLDSVRNGNPQERNFRDIKVLTILEGTSQIMRVIIEGQLAELAGGEEFSSTHPNLIDSLEKILSEKPELVPYGLRGHLRELIRKGKSSIKSGHKYRTSIIGRRAMDLFIEGRALLHMKDKVEMAKGTGNGLPGALYKEYRQKVIRLAKRFNREASRLKDKDVKLRTLKLEGEPGQAIEMIKEYSSENIRPLWDEDSANDKSEEYSYSGREERDKEANKRRADVIRNFAELGVMGASLDPDPDFGLDVVFRNQALEEIAKDDTAVALMMLEQEKSMAVLKEFDELPAELLSVEKIIATATEDVPGDAVTAQRIAGDVYQLNGKKQFVFNGLLADQLIVFAQLDGQLSAFLVDVNEDVTKTASNALGLNKTGLVDINFDNTNAKLIGEAGQGDLILSYLRANEAGALLSISRGQARRLISEARSFVQGRQHPSGKPNLFLYDLPPVREMINDAIRLVNGMTEENAAESLHAVAELMIQASGGSGYDLDSSITTMRHDTQTLNVRDVHVKRSDLQMTGASSPAGDEGEFLANMRELAQQMNDQVDEGHFDTAYDTLRAIGKEHASRGNEATKQIWIDAVTYYLLGLVHKMEKNIAGGQDLMAWSVFGEILEIQKLYGTEETARIVTEARHIYNKSNIAQRNPILR